MLGRVELRFFRSLDHLVLVREFSPEDVVERLQVRTSGAHVRSPRGGRERGSSAHHGC